MIKIGITGQSGFIGAHLYNYLGLTPEKFLRIPFDDSYFNEIGSLSKFVSGCDVIVHLAAINRLNDQEELYKTNIDLVKKLLFACESACVKPHIIFSSSIQEERDNPYGRSKIEGRNILIDWAKKNNSGFTGLIIPNVFGPFCKPFYNSVVATFCFQLTHNDIPRIEIDAVLKLIYIENLVTRIICCIDNHSSEIIEKLEVTATCEIRVSELLQKLFVLKEKYFDKGIFPDLNNAVERELFFTFLSYFDFKKFFPIHLKMVKDERGTFTELLKSDNLSQVSFSVTRSGITRGNHFHTGKVERFAVIKGKARIEIRKVGSNDKIAFDLDGENPSCIDMPVWYTHNITNTGTEDLYTIFWISKFYDQNNSDTFFELV